jgi:hypothetical protein
MVPLFLRQLEACRLINAPRRHQYIVGPQRQSLLSLGSREVDAAIHEMHANA